LARVLPAIVILLATWLLLWLVQGVPVLCALANPCAAPDVRVAPAMLFGALMIVPTAALVLTARGGERAWKWLRTLSYIALAGLAVVGLGAALFSGGFTVPFVF
jgi:hypothetical protein